MEMAVMVGHHDHAVNDNAERYGDSSQRVKMEFYFEEIVKYESDRKIGHQADGDKLSGNGNPGLRDRQIRVKLRW